MRYQRSGALNTAISLNNRVGIVPPSPWRFDCLTHILVLHFDYLSYILVRPLNATQLGNQGYIQKQMLHCTPFPLTGDASKKRKSSSNCWTYSNHLTILKAILKNHQFSFWSASSFICDWKVVLSCNNWFQGDSMPVLHAPCKMWFISCAFLPLRILRILSPVFLDHSFHYVPFHSFENPGRMWLLMNVIEQLCFLGLTAFQ